ncbi:PPC domain-containing protein [Leptolyngbya sp. AN02str]|uniref:PPC domain-containing protein n=1 Tax=Leptolyngbya sp. AN02str TaxID=3423363 RepID=UPI003D30F50D
MKLRAHHGITSLLTPQVVVMTCLGVGMASSAIAQMPVSSQMGSEAAIAQSSPILLQRQGVLEPGDSILESDGSLYDTYFLNGRAGQQIMISLESDEFDTYLAILTPDGAVLAENDDADDTNSFLEVTLPSSGEYQLIINGYDSNSQGWYTVTVSEVEG